LDVVLVLGDTGIPRRRDLAWVLARRWGLKPGSGSISRAIRRARDAGLIELIIPRQEAASWRPGHLVRLTDRGADLYRMVRGRDPAESLTTQLLKRHKSVEHTALNIAAAEMLWQAGYHLELLPQQVETAVGTYYPDLTAELDGRTLYVECERATRKNDAERVRKWELYRSATSSFAVVTFSAHATEAIRREIIEWSRGAGERVTLWMTDLERGVGQRGEAVWVVKEELKPG